MEEEEEEEEERERAEAELALEAGGVWWKFKKYMIAFKW